MSNYSSRLLVGLLLVGVSLAASPSAWAQEYEITPPPMVLTHVPFDIRVQTTAVDAPALLQMRTDGATFDAERLADGSYLVSGITVRATGPADFELIEGERIVAEATTRAIPGWVSILPPLLAILSALIIRNVIPALFLGLWFGAMAVNGFSITGAFTGMFDAFQVYLLTALFDEGRISIILFSFMIGGMVGIISKNGGMQGVVKTIVPLAGSPKKGQAATGLLGLVVFFDDFANTLVVGNTMRPVTDRLRVSREKLAYLVDSTAAPVACVALVTTWIGYEVGLITEAVELIDGYDEAAYSVFLNSIAYSFYPLLAIVFVFIVAFSGRDFGPMYEAEARARTTGQVLSSDARVDESAGASNLLAPADGRPHRAVNAALPVLVLVGGVLHGALRHRERRYPERHRRQRRFVQGVDVGLAVGCRGGSRSVDLPAHPHAGRHRRCLVRRSQDHAAWNDHPVHGLGSFRRDERSEHRRLPRRGTWRCAHPGARAGDRVRAVGGHRFRHRLELGNHGDSHAAGAAAHLGGTAGQWHGQPR